MNPFLTLSLSLVFRGRMDSSFCPLLPHARYHCLLSLGLVIRVYCSLSGTLDTVSRFIAVLYIISPTYSMLCVLVCWLVLYVISAHTLNDP